MRANVIPLYLLVFFMLTCSCHSNWREHTKVDADEASLQGNIDELQLPEVPSSLTSPEERTEFIIAHYISLFPQIEANLLQPLIGKMLEQVAADSVCLTLVNEFARHYLYNPNSPMRNEEYYSLFLEEFLKITDLPESERIRSSYYLEIANKNRKGSVATDFRFLTAGSSQEQSLSGVEAQWLLLIFYDPECSHCTETLSKIAASDNINRMVADGSMKVLAIYTEGKMDVWKKSLSHMPKNWTVGYDCSGIVDNDLYIIDAMPTLYLLDNSKTVVLKDPTLSALDRWMLQNHHPI